MSPELRALTRAIFLRLVTPERTRAVVDQDELTGLHHDPAELEQLIQHLASARLIVVQTSGTAAGGATVEIVHESLLTAWPRLRRWLDANQEDTAFLAQLREASRQWENRGRNKDLLWRGDALEEAVRFKKSYTGPLSDLESDYLDASVQLATRAQRVKRATITGAFLLLSGLIFVGSIALVRIRSAEREAVKNAQLAETEAARAKAGEATIEKQLTQLQEKEAARLKAEKEALHAVRTANLTREELEEAYAKIKTQLTSLSESGSRIEAARQETRAAQRRVAEAEGVAKLGREELEKAYAKMQVALAEARAAKVSAQDATARAKASEGEARAAKAQAEALLQKERAKNAELRSKIITDLR